MAVSSVTILSPPDNFITSGFRPRTNIVWSGGTGPFDVVYEWDTTVAFNSGNLLTDTNNGVTSPDEGVPPSDMGPFGTDWFLRVTITDTNDDVNEIQSIFNDASGGDFTLSFDGQGPTSAILWNDSAANVESALEGLSNITNVTVTGAGTSGDPWLVTFVDPGFQDVALMTANDAGLTGQTVGTTIAEDTAGSSSTGTVAPAGGDYGLLFVDPADHPRYLWVNHNVGLNFIEGVDGDPKAAARYLYVNHNVGVGFGPGLPDGDPREFNRYLYVNHNVTDEQPCPYLQSVAPSLQVQGGSVTLFGDAFGATQATYVTEIRLYETQDLLGGSYVTMAATSWSDDEVTVTVPNGSSSGFVAVVQTNGSETCDGSAFKILNVVATEPNPLMGWWIQTVDKQNAVTAESTILPYNVSGAGFKKIMGAVGSGFIEIPLSDPDLDAIVDPIMRKGVLIRVYLDDVFRYAFYAEKLSYVYVEEGVGVARITGRGMEVVAQWTKVLPHDYPALPTQNPTWVYGSNENFVLNPGFDDADDDPIIQNPGGEDGNDDDGNAEGWGAVGDDLDSITAIQDALLARTDDWYIEIAASDNHSGMTQSIPVTPNRVYHVRAWVSDFIDSGMRVTLALGGADDIAAIGITYPNNFVFDNEILAELDNVASNGQGTPGGSTDGTWQQLDVEVLTGAEQTSLSIKIQNDHHKAGGVFTDFGVDDVTVEGWGLGLDPWTAYAPTDHATNSFRLDDSIAFDGSALSVSVNPLSSFAGIQQIITLNPNAKYQFSAWLHTASIVAGDTWRLVVRLNDGSETFIADTADIEPGVGVWTNFTFVATMPNIEDVEVIFRFAYTGPNNPGPVHMDSFSIVPGEPPSSAGTIVNDILDAMNDAGKLQFLQRTWTGAVDDVGDPDTDLDSNAQPWPSLLSLDIKPNESLLSVLERLTALGHEWEIVPVNFIEGGDTGFELNLFTARSFNAETGIGSSHVNDPNGPVITPGDATMAGRIVKTAFNTNTIFAIGDDGVWSSAQQFPYETGDIPASDPAPLGYRESFGIIEEVITVSASDTTTIGKYADARLKDEKGKESQLQLKMQRASDVRPFLHFGVGDSMFIDMPPDNPDPLDPTTGLRKYQKRIRAIGATLKAEGADVQFLVDADRVVYEDELAWLAMIAQLAERSPVEQTGQGTGTVSGTGGVVSIIGGSTGTSAHQHKLGSSEITDRTVSGDISGTLPGPLAVNKVKGMAVSNTLPTEDEDDETLLVYDYDLKQWVPETFAGGGGGGGGTLESYNDVVQEMSPVHRWDFDESSGDVLDKVGSLDLTVSGGVVRQAPSLVGSGSLGLDGIDGQAVASVIGDIPTGADERTIVVLYKPNVDNQSGSNYLFSYGAPTADNFAGIAFAAAGVEGRMLFPSWASDITADVGGDDKNWHLAAWGTRNGVLYAFHDGQHITLETAINTSTGPLEVGRRLTGLDYAGADIDSLFVLDTWAGWIELDRLWRTLTSGELSSGGSAAVYEALAGQQIALSTGWLTSSTTINNPANAINNNPLNSSLYADFGSLSQWLKVDLQSVRVLTGFRFVPYYVDFRSHKDVFFEVSEDDTVWETVYDIGAGNQVLGNIHGLTVSFPGGKDVRYIRYNVNGNSSNDGNHLVEIMVYEQYTDATFIAGGAGGVPADSWLANLFSRPSDESRHGDDDEFTDETIDPSWVAVNPTGTAIWTPKGDVMGVEVTGQASGDVAPILKPMTGATTFPISIQAPTRVLSKDFNYIMWGMMFADGTAGSSNCIITMPYIQTAGMTVSFRRGTIDNIATTIATYNGGEDAPMGFFHQRLIWTAANTFKMMVSADGVHWIDHFGGQSFTFTPTHYGVYGSVWGGAVVNLAMFDYFRVTESDLSL